jgi:hypothetical protein
MKKEVAGGLGVGEARRCWSKNQPLHMAIAPALKAVVKTEISKLDSYLSLQGDNGRGGLYPCLVGLI